MDSVCWGGVWRVQVDVGGGEMFLIICSQKTELLQTNLGCSYIKKNQVAHYGWQVEALMFVFSECALFLVSCMNAEL